MRIRNVIHKGLRRLIEEDDASGLPAAIVPKIRKIVSFLQDMEGENELRTVPSWKAHQMAGDRKGAWSLFITRNWRVTFKSTRTRSKSSISTARITTRRCMMAQADGIRMKNPAHPGGFVKSEVLNPLGLSVTDAARALGVTRAALSTFLNERASLSPDMAIRVEKAFGVSMETLMRMQNSFDIAHARQRKDEIAVARYVLSSIP